MPHLVIAGKLHAAGLELARAAPGVTLDYVEDVSEAALLAHLPKAEALVLRTQPLTAASVAQAPHLRIVSRHGVGYDAVDLAALTARGIPLAIVGDVNSVSVAEHAMMLLLAAAKRALRGHRAVAEPGGWGWRNRFEGVELAGKRLLIVGFGRTGRHLARMAAAFGMEVRACDPVLAAKGWPEEAVRSVDLAEGLGWADAVSVHVPGGARPLLGAAELALLRPGAILVNTARGGVVDEGALVEALDGGRIGAAGIDVFVTEPPEAGHPLARFDQVILSPHIAGMTAESAERMAVVAVRNALDGLAGRPDPAMIVNPEVLEARHAPPA
ncbi:MAG: 3-phosphoglycerate dehydrogenase [Rubellimicrobium sp.]|nr:3-phosphoglycerate dehydrogenase [Rubellimicrobium sp.]